jgi:diaminopimelate epimerase
MKLIKSHAFGNDFLLVDAGELPASADIAALARTVCDRHRGVGADGLLIFTVSANPRTREPANREPADRVSMRLLNADGSPSEISGNGLRCLAAWLAHTGSQGEIVVDTDAGRKRLQLLARASNRYTFSAAMGEPEQIALERIDVGGVEVEAVTLRVGNPQCVVLGEVTTERLHTLGSALAVHPRFPEGTNVELATVESPDRVRILIWERGVGPTEASGTGACASAVAAIAYGGASREVDIASPGGTQHVAWRDDGLHLTGWAEIVAEVNWLAV